MKEQRGIQRLPLYWLLQVERKKLWNFFRMLKQRQYRQGVIGKLLSSFIIWRIVSYQSMKETRLLEYLIRQFPTLKRVKLPAIRKTAWTAHRYLRIFR